MTEVTTNATLMIDMVVQSAGNISIVFLITPLESLFPKERYPTFFFVTSFICLILFTYVYFFFRETSGLTDKEKKNLFAKKSK